MSNKALLVGVNKYKIPGSNLQGCVNDATNIRDILLKYYGFTVNDIRVLVDDRATKKAILERLNWLVKDIKSGDRLLFHFSGHGSQIRDRDGDELRDNLDEILCPHDMDWDGTYIVDDDLKAIFSALPAGVRLEVLLDCCHSGSGTREAASFIMLNAAQDKSHIIQRFLTPPIDILCREAVDEDLKVQKIGKSSSSQSHVLFSGCRDNQTSADAFIGGSYNGAFTYYFCRHLRDTQAAVTRAELLKRLRASLKYEGFSQVPQLECPAAWRKKKLFE